MEELLHKNTCSNCDYSPLNASFCPNCGQRKLTKKDLKLGVLIQEAIQGIFNFENAFFRTLKAFFISPSEYVTSYNLGKRKKYTSPIKWFLIANAIYFLFPFINTFTTSLQIQLNGLIYSNLINNWVEALINSSGLDFVTFQSQYNNLTKTLSKVFLLALPLMFSCLTYFTNLKERNKKPLLFHINYSLILFSWLLAIILCLLPVIYYLIYVGNEVYINDVTITTASFVLLNIYGIFLYRGFFRSGSVKNVLRIILLNVSFYLLIFIYRFMLLLITLGWMQFN